MQIDKREHYINSNGVKIYLLEKFLSANNADEKPPLLMVHGATWPGGPVFDLPKEDYSLLDFFARFGFHAWYLDIHGYGKSHESEDDWSELTTAVADLTAAIEYILTHNRAKKIALLGWSWGAQIIGKYAMSAPEKISRLIFYGPLWQGTPELKNIPLPAEKFRVNTDVGAREDFTAGQYEEDVIELFVDEALRVAPRSPNGVLRDVRNLPLLDPALIVNPIMIVHGANDKYAREADLMQFFQNLAAREKTYTVLPLGGHIIHLERPRQRFRQAVLNFLLQ